MTQMIWTFYEEVKSIFNFIYKNNIIIYTYAINIQMYPFSQKFPVSIYKNREYTGNPAQYPYIN